MTDRPALALIPPTFLAALGPDAARTTPAEVCVLVDDDEHASSHDERRLDLALGASATVIGTHLLSASGLLAVSLRSLVYVETAAALAELELEHECDTCRGRRQAYVEAFGKHAGPNPGAFVALFETTPIPLPPGMAPRRPSLTVVDDTSSTGMYL